MPSSRPGKVRLKTDPQVLIEKGLLLESRLAGAPLDLPGIFGNSRPIELEVGPGKGTFLLRRAQERPEMNFLAIEWVGSYAAYVADRALRAGLDNVRLISADAEQLFKKALPDKSIWRVHVYFPDPWPKTKHRRRRLIKPAFVGQIRRVLQIGGQVGVVTDHAEYFQQIQRIFDRQAGLIQVDFGRAQDQGGYVGTNFEKKYLAGGKSFFALSAIRYQ